MPTPSMFNRTAGADLRPACTPGRAAFRLGNAHPIPVPPAQFAMVAPALWDRRSLLIGLAPSLSRPLGAVGRVFRRNSGTVPMPVSLTSGLSRM